MSAVRSGSGFVACVVTLLSMRSGIEAGAPGSLFDYLKMNSRDFAERTRRQTRPPSSSSSHAASMCGDVGKTTVAVNDVDRKNGNFLAGAFSGTGGIGENIYGPFEAGFSGSGKQANIIQNLGCADPTKVELPGGADTTTAEKIIGGMCGIELPRTESSGKWVSLLDKCGGHTKEYHNHEKLICLYDENAGGHSTKVGESVGGVPIYGKYETTGVVPLLDACNGHWGVTPDSQGKSVYHYHVTDAPPFVIGCKGPNDDGSLVTVKQCRDFYTGCGDDDATTLTATSANIKTLGTGKGTQFTLEDGSTLTYDLYCPCYDANGSNLGPIAELPIFAGTTTPGATTASTDAGKKPNVVLFMPDDLPFYWPETPEDPAGVGSYGTVLGLMPHLNKLRAEGTVFTQAYTTGPKCAPSRFGMLTGRYPSRGLYAIGRTSSAYTRTQVNVPGSKLDGTDRTKTLQNALADAGITTIVSGKWHIAPEKPTTLFTDYSKAVSNVKETGFAAAVGIYEGNMLAKSSLPFSHNPEWMVATSNKELTSAVAANKQFFLYFAPTAPHTPSMTDALALDAKKTPAGDVDGNAWTGMTRSEMLATTTSDKYLGAVVVDESLGAIYATLETLKVLDNTMIIFTMDHGQIAKDSVYEGGTRVALFVRYPGKIPAGKTIALPVSNLDIAPTILQVFGVSSTLDFDGLSWWDTVQGKASIKLESRQCIVSEIDLLRAVVCGTYKYISNYEAASHRLYPDSADKEQLYDLAKDPKEQTNVAADASYAGVLARMQAYLACHDKDTAKGQATPCDTSALNPLQLTTLAPGETPAPTSPTPAPTPAPPTTSQGAAAAVCDGSDFKDFLVGLPEKRGVDREGDADTGVASAAACAIKCVGLPSCKAFMHNSNKKECSYYRSTTTADGAGPFTFYARGVCTANPTTQASTNAPTATTMSNQVTANQVTTKASTQAPGNTTGAPDTGTTHGIDTKAIMAATEKALNDCINLQNTVAGRDAGTDCSLQQALYDAAKSAHENNTSAALFSSLVAVIAGLVAACML